MQKKCNEGRTITDATGKKVLVARCNEKVLFVACLSVLCTSKKERNATWKNSTRRLKNERFSAQLLHFFFS